MDKNIDVKLNKERKRERERERERERISSLRRLICFAPRDNLRACQEKFQDKFPAALLMQAA